jgi:hypothetical protein
MTNALNVCELTHERTLAYGDGSEGSYHLATVAPMIIGVDQQYISKRERRLNCSTAIGVSTKETMHLYDGHRFELYIDFIDLSLCVRVKYAFISP